MAGSEPAAQNFLQRKKKRNAGSDRKAMLPLQRITDKINNFVVFFSPIHTVWTLWSCIYHEFKDTFKEK